MGVAPNHMTPYSKAIYGNERGCRIGNKGKWQSRGSPHRRSMSDPPRSSGRSSNINRPETGLNKNSLKINFSSNKKRQNQDDFKKNRIILYRRNRYVSHQIQSKSLSPLQTEHHWQFEPKKGIKNVSSILFCIAYPNNLLYLLPIDLFFRQNRHRSTNLH